MSRVLKCVGRILSVLVAVSWSGLLAADPVAIVGATVHTLTEAGVIEEAVILTVDGEIEAVGADLEIPSGYETVDARGKVITPGLIESDSRLGLVEIAGETTTVDALVQEYPSGAAFDVRHALNPASVALAVNRQDGVTRAVVSPAAGNDPFAGWGAAIRLSGETILTRPGIALFAGVGSGTAQFVGGSRSAVIQRMRRGLTLAADYNPNRYRPGPGDFSHQDLAALSEFVGSWAPLVVAVDRANEIREMIALAEDFDRRLIILGGSEAWQLREVLAAREIPVVVNVLANLPTSFDRLGARLDNAALLSEAGVMVLLTGGETQNARRLRQQAGNAVAHGMDWTAALAAMTLNPAVAWGFPQGTGTIAEGAPADLVVWTGDPLELSHWAERVMIDGAWQDMSSRQSRLFERYQSLDDENFQYR